MTIAIKLAKKALRELWKEITIRNNFYMEKPMTWQESVTGDKFIAKTEQLKELADAMDEQLTYY